MVEEKECPGSITLAHNGTFKCMAHNPKHRPMLPIESDVKKIKLEMDEFISSNPTASVSVSMGQKVNWAFIKVFWKRSSYLLSRI